jgi:hypothetical protein
MLAPGILALLGAVSLASGMVAQESPPASAGRDAVSPELPLAIALVDVPPGGPGAGRLRVTIDTNPIFDALLRRRSGRLRVAVFAGSGAARVLESRIEQNMPFDMTIDQWVLVVPVHWSSQDTWIAVEVEENGSGARGKTMIDLPASPSSRNHAGMAKPTASALPMTLALSDVRQTPGGNTGRLSLTIQTALLSQGLKKTAKRLQIVVFEKTGAGNSIAMPIHTTLPVSLESDDWSATLPLRWSSLASALSVEVEETATGIQGAGSIRVRQE